MTSAITNDVLITVEVSYQNRNANGEYMFAYRISIHNKGDFTIQLLKRHWFITDVLNGNSEVEGDGVVGNQPVLEPGETYQYVSGCALVNEFGKMNGYYIMERQTDEFTFKVIIPEFFLQSSTKLN